MKLEKILGEKEFVTCKISFWEIGIDDLGFEIFEVRDLKAADLGTDEISWQLYGSTELLYYGTTTSSR